MYSKPLENSPVQFQWKVWGSTRITKFKRRIFYFISSDGWLVDWCLAVAVVFMLCYDPPLYYVWRYEYLYFIYLAELAVVGRNSLYLLFIAVAVWPRTLNRTHPHHTTAHHTTPHHTTPHHTTLHHTTPHHTTLHHQLSSDLAACLLVLQESVLCLQLETKRKQWGGDNVSQGCGIT